MHKESALSSTEVFKHTLYLLLLLALSFLAVYFPTSSEGKIIRSESDLDLIKEPTEKRVASALLRLGFQPAHELQTILLSRGFTIKRKGEDKIRDTTIPDFHIQLWDEDRLVDCYIEVCSGRNSSGKKLQHKVATRAIDDRSTKNMIYTQFFLKEVNELEKVQTKEELLEFIYRLRLTISTDMR